MPFGELSRMDPRNQILDGGPDHRSEVQILGEMTCLCMLDDTAVSCTKTAEPIEMLFWLWARVGLRNHVLDGIQISLCEGAIFRVKDVPRACLTTLCCELCKNG